MRSTSQQFQIGPPITHIDLTGHGTAYGRPSALILGTDAEPFEFVHGAIRGPVLSCGRYWLLEPLPF
jgi:hypothetical protein